MNTNIGYEYRVRISGTNIGYEQVMKIGHEQVAVQALVAHPTSEALQAIYDEVQVEER